MLSTVRLSSLTVPGRRASAVVLSRQVEPVVPAVGVQAPGAENVKSAAVAETPPKPLDLSVILVPSSEGGVAVAVAGRPLLGGGNQGGKVRPPPKPEWNT
jgi:hypothetical protein